MAQTLLIGWARVANPGEPGCALLGPSSFPSQTPWLECGRGSASKLPLGSPLFFLATRRRSCRLSLNSARPRPIDKKA
jgi:hypothetical protein